MRKSARTQIPPFFDNDPYNIGRSLANYDYCKLFFVLRNLQNGF